MGDPNIRSNNAKVGTGGERVQETVGQPVSENAAPNHTRDPPWDLSKSDRGQHGMGENYALGSHVLVFLWFL